MLRFGQGGHMIGLGFDPLEDQFTEDVCMSIHNDRPIEARLGPILSRFYQCLTQRRILAESLELTTERVNVVGLEQKAVSLMFNHTGNPT